MKQTCGALISAFWIDGTLTTRVAGSIIKFVPKSQHIRWLLNWRPLTMLTLTEKLCTKILANRFKGPIGKVTDQQQIGLLAERNIMDNLLAYKLAKEFFTKTKHESLLLEANFMKAYDWVEHIFLWSRWNFWDITIIRSFWPKVSWRRPSPRSTSMAYLPSPFSLSEVYARDAPYHHYYSQSPCNYLY